MFLDFIFNNDIFSKNIFRFYPEKSVYEINKETKRICYNWEILWQLADNEPVTLFSINDENSALILLSKYIKSALNQPDQMFKYNTNSQPGSDWTIIYKSKTNECKFTVFNNFFDNGFRFVLNREDTYDFMHFLDKINEQMKKESKTN